MTIRTQFDLAYGTNPRQRLDLFTPGTDRFAKLVIIFIHGGSWKSGDKRSYRFVGRTLSRMGVTTILPNYRLYPEVQFPGFVQDGALAAKWVRERYPDRRIVLAGHSAGALNAALLAFSDQYLDAADRGAVAGFIGLSGPYDFNPRPDIRPIFAATNPAEWEPVNRVGRPHFPTLLLHGRLDVIVKYANSVSMGQAIGRAGGPVTLKLYPHLGHISMLLPLVPGLGWLAPVRRQIKRFLVGLD